MAQAVVVAKFQSSRESWNVRSFWHTQCHQHEAAASVSLQWWVCFLLPPLFQLYMLWSFLPLRHWFCMSLHLEWLPLFSLCPDPIFNGKLCWPLGQHCQHVGDLHHSASYLVIILSCTVCIIVCMVSGIPVCSLRGRSGFILLNITYKTRNIIGA